MYRCIHVYETYYYDTSVSMDICKYRLRDHGDRQISHPAQLEGRACQLHPGLPLPLHLHPARRWHWQAADNVVERAAHAGLWGPHKPTPAPHVRFDEFDGFRSR